jgi:hypothetical protein
MFGVHALACVSCILLFTTGCSTGGAHVDTATWQRNVETYVTDVGRGDPVVLRDVRYKDRPAFAQIGHPVPGESTDVVGLLLGPRTVNARPSLVYLVATLDRQVLQEMRLAVLQPITSQGRPTQFKWILGNKDDAALKKYRDHQRRRTGAKTDTFPADADAFDLTVNPTAVTATEKASGATWTLPLKR